MRMDTKDNEVTAQKLVMETPEEGLANIIYQYGQERKSRHIAHRICKVREEREIATTNDLSDIINSVVPRGPRGLLASEKLLKNDGRAVIVTFHSLEDSIVKRFFDDKSGRRSNKSRHLPDLQVEEQALPTFRVLKRKAIEASNDELQENPRSRSAKLRMAVRVNKGGAA